ncbi:MAG: rhamnan synthesis F family protein [Pseudotabrizicola sp.]|nr:rhamnan synthesis F family protein [Pseudotabrizicola sp.]
MDKIAIYLIFQPKGLCISTLETCRILARQGYSVLIVSNGQLAENDIALLRDQVWAVLIRPNYGYDFGGYRDGILHLFDVRADPAKLLVMNDSIWFPTGPEDTLLPRMEASGIDVTGTVVHRSHRSKTRQGFGSRVIESYFFLFDRHAVRSECFRSFWQRYRLSSNKYNAVYRGERKITEEMRKGGLTADGLFGREDFMTALEQQDSEFLRKTLFYAAYTDDVFRAEGEALLSEPVDAQNWRANVIDHIRRVTLKRNFHGAFVFASMTLLDMPFLKKGTGTFLKRTYGTLYTRMRERYLAAVMAGDLPRPRSEVIDEIVQRDGVKLDPH